MANQATSSGNNSLDYMAPRLNSTSLPKKENVVVNEDRLSVLPNDVAHRILSFLSIDEIGKLSFASKSCEKLCLTVPSLLIDDRHSLSFPKGFMDFLVHFMRSRRGANLAKLSILWPCRKLKYNEIFRLMWLLNHAMECQVNDIDIRLSLETGVVFVMPQDVLCCESLISLKINLKYGDGGFASINNGALEFPSPHGFAYLRSLHLISLRIDGDSLGEQISYVCKFLEKLTLEFLSAMQKFKISSQSLLELTIVHCSIEHLDISATSLQTISLRRDKIITSTNVYAPNLLCFDWCKSSCENLNFVENPSLLHTLDLTLRKDHPEMIKLDNLLPIIVQVSYLIINLYTIQALYEDRHLQLIFNNLLKLDLHLDYYSSLTAPLVQKISRFLQGLPCSLKKLHIMTYSFKTSDSEDHTYDTKFWELRNLRLVQGLEEFKVNLFGRNYEESLLEYLLENAKKLKKITISFTKSMPSTIVCKLMTSAVARGARFCVEGQNTMVFELK